MHCVKTKNDCKVFVIVQNVNSLSVRNVCICTSVFLHLVNMLSCRVCQMSESKQLGTYMVTKYGSLSVKLEDDSKDCCITGIAITEDGRIILADFENRILKMFRQNMLFITSLCLLNQPWDIAVLSNQEIVVSMSGKQLAFIDISADQISITNTLRLQFDIYGVALYEDKLIVTSMTSGNLKIPSVKLIDKTGKVQWTVTLSQEGKQLFVWSMYVRVLNHNMTAYVIVTDSGNCTLTLLRAFIKRSWLDMSTAPLYIATDSQYILTTYIGTEEIEIRPFFRKGTGVQESKHKVPKVCFFLV